MPRGTVKTRDNTELMTFLACPRRWYYRYRELLAPRHKALALDSGSVLHECCQLIYQGREWRPKLLGWETEKTAETGNAEEAGAVADRAARVTAVLAEYELYVRERADFRLVAGEQEFLWRVPGTRTVLAGRVDGILEGPAGARWLLELKSTSHRYDLHLLGMDRQLLTYLQALQGKVSNLIGVQMHVLYLGLPRAQVNKDGKPSTAYNQHTDGDTLSEAIAAAQAEGIKLDPGLYAEVLARLPSRRDYMLQFFANSYTTDQLARFLSADIVPLCRMMDDAIGKDHTPRNTSQLNCKLCAYAPLCFGEFKGDDVGELRTMNYYVTAGPREHLNGNTGWDEGGESDEQ